MCIEQLLDGAGGLLNGVLGGVLFFLFLFALFSMVGHNNSLMGGNADAFLLAKDSIGSVGCCLLYGFSMNNTRSSFVNRIWSWALG